MKQRMIGNMGQTPEGNRCLYPAYPFFSCDSIRRTAVSSKLNAKSMASRGRCRYTPLRNWLGLSIPEPAGLLLPDDSCIV